MCVCGERCIRELKKVKMREMVSCGACVVASTLYLLRHAASNRSTNTKKQLKNERNKERERAQSK